MCADIHDGQEQKRSIQGPDTEAQDQPSPDHHIQLATHGRSIQSATIGVAKQALRHGFVEVDARNVSFCRLSRRGQVSCNGPDWKLLLRGRGQKIKQIFGVLSYMRPWGGRPRWASKYFELVAERARSTTSA